jgi:hypothetical protein
MICTVNRPLEIEFTLKSPNMPKRLHLLQKDDRQDILGESLELPVIQQDEIRLGSCSPDI